MLETLHAPNLTVTNGTPNPVELSELDISVLRFRKAIQTDTLPTGIENRDLAREVQQGDSATRKASMVSLLENHTGLIATIVYYHGSNDNESELMLKGKRALVEATATFDTRDKTDFSDYAEPIIENSIINSSFEVPKKPFSSHRRPMEGILSFISGLGDNDPDSPVARLKAYREHLQNARTLLTLSPRQRTILPFTHLSSKIAARNLPLEDAKSFRNLASYASTKLGVNTREGLALAAFNLGVKFEDITELDVTLDQFTLIERRVATRLDKQNAVISKELGLSTRQVDSLTSALLRKTGARTRGEVLILAHMHSFEPTEEEMGDPIPEALLILTPRRRDILQRIHLQTCAEIADELGTTKDSIDRTVFQSKQKLGGTYHNHTALVLELFKRGLQFEIATPKQPLPEILSERELSIARSLGNSFEEIGQAHNIGKTRMGRIVKSMKSKTGARTMVELALMVRSYDANEQHTRQRHSLNGN